MMDFFEVSRIKVVFMDVGGVLLTNGWDHESRQEAAKKFNLDYIDMEAKHNFIYNVFEIGSITLDDYLDTVVFDRSRNFSKDDFKKFMFAQSTELPKFLSWLKNWKRQTQLPVFAVNNESRELNDYRIDTFALHQVFDGFFSSCYMKVRKPDPRIFEKALEIAHVKAKECVYFDDRQMLVNAAKKVGINSIQHQEFEIRKAILENFI